MPRSTSSAPHRYFPRPGERVRRCGMNPDVPEELVIPMPSDFAGGRHVLVDLGARQGPVAVGESADDAAWRPTAAWVELLDDTTEPDVLRAAPPQTLTTICVTLEDGACNGHRTSWQAPGDDPHVSVTWHESTTTDFVLAMTEHFIPARVGTTDPEQIIETMAVSYLIDELDVKEARRLLLPALERLTHWCIAAFDLERATLVYGGLPEC